MFKLLNDGNIDLRVNASRILFSSGLVAVFKRDASEADEVNYARNLFACTCLFCASLLTFIIGRDVLAAHREAVNINDQDAEYRDIDPAIDVREDIYYDTLETQQLGDVETSKGYLDTNFNDGSDHVISSNNTLPDSSMTGATMDKSKIIILPKLIFKEM